MIRYTTKYADSWNLDHISNLFEEVIYYFDFIQLHLSRMNQNLDRGLVIIHCISVNYSLMLSITANSVNG